MPSALVLDLQDSSDETKSVSATLYLSAFCDIDASVATAITSDIVDAKYAKFEVNPVYIYRGAPVAHTDKGILANMSGGFVSGSYARSGAPSSVDSLGAISRWIADTSTVSGYKWYPVAGDDRSITFKPLSDAQFPYQYTTDYTYLNGSKYVVLPSGTGAFQITSDTYLASMNRSFSDGTHTFIAVFIARAYQSDPVCIISTGNPDGEVDAPGLKFASVKYLPEGRIGLYYDSNPYPVSTVKITDRGLSQARPVIAYLSVNASTSIVSYGALSATSLSRRHSVEHEYSGNIYIGGSPYSDATDYVVDYLDVMYAKNAEVSQLLARLDFMYGVTV